MNELQSKSTLSAMTTDPMSGIVSERSTTTDSISNSAKWAGLGILSVGMLAYIYVSLTDSTLSAKASGMFRWIDVLIGILLFLGGVMLIRKVF